MILKKIIKKITILNFENKIKKINKRKSNLNGIYEVNDEERTKIFDELTNSLSEWVNLTHSNFLLFL